MGRFHPLQPAYLADPYPYLARLRETEPVLYSPDMQGYVLTRFSDCAAVLRDPDHFSSDPGNESSGLGDSVRKARACAALGAAPVLANTDGPVHDRLRRVLADAFRAGNVAGSREAIRATVGPLVEQLIPDRPCSVMKVLAEPAPLLILLDFLGIEPSEHDTFRKCVISIMRGRMDGDRDPRAAQESVEAASALAGLVEREQHGVVAFLREATSEGQLTAEEMLMLLVHVASAGNAATAFAIGNALLCFARHPAAWEQLRARPELLSKAIEECLRFESPTHVTSRFAAEGAEVSGRKIPKGRAVHLVVAAANRDPEAFPDPDRFDITRRQGPQATFGLGIHVCLGAALGRLELEVILGCLLERYAQIELAPDGYEAGSTIFLRGPRKLVLIPRASGLPTASANALQSA